MVFFFENAGKFRLKVKEFILLVKTHCILESFTIIQVYALILKQGISSLKRLTPF